MRCVEIDLPVPAPLPGAVTKGVFGRDDNDDPVDPSEEEVWPGEANFYSAADAAWNYLQSRPDIDKNKIIVMGWSMGAGIAVDLASRINVAGLAIFNAFTTLPAMARKEIPWAPTGLLLQHRFDNKSKISGIHCPVFICNGRLDTLVPPAMSDDLAHIAGGPVTRLVIDSADHNTIFAAEPDVVWSALGKWIDHVAGGG